MAIIEDKIKNVDKPAESLESQDKTQINNDEILDSDYDTEDEIARLKFV